MTVWLLVAMLGGGLVETDVFYTKERCEQFARMVLERGGAALCSERNVRR